MGDYPGGEINCPLCHCMNSLSGEEAIANYTDSLCIACDCFVSRPAPSALSLAMTHKGFPTTLPHPIPYGILYGRTD